MDKAEWFEESVDLNHPALNPGRILLRKLLNLVETSSPKKFKEV